jgi:hypothetical protein
MLASINAFADHTNSVSVDEARQKALYFLSYQPTFVKGRNQAPQKLSDLNLAHQALLKNGQTAYYIFSNEAGGFVIISGDERTEDVLGYSSEGVFDADNMPENMKGWLDEYATQIAYIQEHGLSSPSIRKIQSYPSIAPMLTTTWSQYSPYNDECPDFFGQGKCITGCGATAMAQLMYYHREKSVTETLATIPAYTTQSYNINVDAIPAGSPIDWDNMLDSYNGSEAPAEELAVSNLMKYCGASVKMDYSMYWSSSSNDEICLALKAFFNYNYSTAWEYRDNYPTDEEWDNLIYKELTNNRPVMYNGESDNGGHFFICDGYDGNGYYHINWGWGGSCDGYFLLSTLDPSKPYQNHPGISSGYNRSQSALINAAPRDVIPSGDGIVFADARVKLLCLQNWDTNDDGDFSMEEVAAVTELGAVFQWQKSISSFDELQFFTGLTYIDSYAFFGSSSLTSVTLPASVKGIGWGAFMDCRGLTAITIPDGVTEIASNAFDGCLFAKDSFINFSAQRSDDNWGATICDKEPEDGLFVNGTVVVGCRPWVTSVNIPDVVTVIGDDAFYGCSNLSSITIPNGVTSIGREAFRGCFGLSSVTVPEGVTSIGVDAFWNCYNLRSVRLPNSLTSIGGGAFQYCYSLSSINIPNNVSRIGNGALDGTPWFDNQQNGLVYAGKVAYKYKGEMPDGTMITLKNGTLGIAEDAFKECSGLTSITIPNGVTNIGDYAFSGCNGLKEIYCYAEETPEISYYTFYNVDVSRVMLVVPDDVVDKYKAHPIWRRFRIETPTGIPSIEDGKSKMEDGSIYNLSGQRLSKPIKGINVLNGKKVAIK